MSDNSTFHKFEEGSVISLEKRFDLSEVEWAPHPSFKGVFTKTIIEQEQTDGKICCLLVKISPNCEMALHKHEGFLEIHEIIQGFGIFTLDSKSYDYMPGNLAIIPPNTYHSIVAGDNGLQLFAKFV